MNEFIIKLLIINMKTNTMNELTLFLEFLQINKNISYLKKYSNKIEIIQNENLPESIQNLITDFLSFK